MSAYKGHDNCRPKRDLTVNIKWPCGHQTKTVLLAVILKDIVDIIK